MALIILRCIFLLCTGGVSAIINTSLTDTSTSVPWLVFAGIMLLAVAVVVADIYWPRKRIDTISSIYFGVLIGVLLTYVLSIALAPLLQRSFNAPVIQLVIALHSVLPVHQRAAADQG